MGADTENPTKEITEPEGASISPKQNTAYSLIPRNLKEEDLTNKSVGRLILSEMDRLQAENTEYKEWEGKFHLADKENGILKEKIKTIKSLELLSSGAIAVGSLIAGSSINPFNVTYFIFGILLMVVGFLAKAVKLL